MQEEWLKALQEMTYGIYVLTAATKDEQGGMIASWVTQVSYEPPLILVAVHPKRYTHKLILESGSFALQVIKKEQKEFLTRFKGKIPREKFSALDWCFGQTGSPVLANCLSFFECLVQEKISPGNHTLFLGKIVNAKKDSQGVPLSTLDYEGMYLGRE